MITNIPACHFIRCKKLYLNMYDFLHAKHTNSGHVIVLKKSLLKSMFEFLSILLVMVFESNEGLKRFSEIEN